MKWLQQRCLPIWINLPAIQPSPHSQYWKSTLWTTFVSFLTTLQYAIQQSGQAGKWKHQILFVYQNCSGMLHFIWEWEYVMYTLHVAVMFITRGNSDNVKFTCYDQRWLLLCKPQYSSNPSNSGISGFTRFFSVGIGFSFFCLFNSNIARFQPIFLKQIFF